MWQDGWLAGCCHRRCRSYCFCFCFCFSVLTSSPFLALAPTITPLPPQPFLRFYSRCRSSLLRRSLRCFTYVPNRCMYVYTPVRNNAGRATTLALACYPFSGQPPSPSPVPSRPALPRGCHHPYRATPTLTATYTLYRRPPTSPVSSPGHHPLSPISPSSSSLPPVIHSSPSQLCEHGVTASTIRNAHHHPLLSLPSRTPSFSPFPAPLLFPFLFPLPSSSNARSNPPGG